MNRFICLILLLAGSPIMRSATVAESLLFKCRYALTLNAEVAGGNARPLRSTNVAYVDGPAGKVLELRHGFVEYAAAGNLNAASGSIVLGITFATPGSSEARQHVFAWKGIGPDWLVIDADLTNRTVSVFIRGVNNAMTRLAAAVPWDQTTAAQLAVTWELPELRIIWNGVVVGRTDLRCVVSRPPPSFFVGGAPPSAATFRLDELCICSRSLNFRELSELRAPPVPPALTSAELLQHDYSAPALVIPFAVQLRGRFSDQHQLRLEGPGVSAVSVPWDDFPTFVLPHTLPPGTNDLVLSLVEGDHVLGQITNWACGWSSFGPR